MTSIEDLFTKEEVKAILGLVDAGEYPDMAGFIRDAVKEKLLACTTGRCKALDERAARHDIEEYFKAQGEAYPSDACLDLGLDYDYICKVIDDLKREGKLGEL